MARGAAQCLAVPALALLALVGPIAGARCDVILDTSFEPEEQQIPDRESPDGWEFALLTADSDAVGAWRQASARTGKASLELAPTGGACAWVGPRESISPATWVRASAWVRTWQFRGTVAVGMLWYDKTGRAVGEVRSTPPDRAADWDRLCVEAPAPAQAATLRPVLLAYGSGMAWFDDLRLVSRDEPALRLLSMTAAGTTQGSSWAVSLSIEATAPMRAAGSITLQLVCLSDGSTACEATFATGFDGGLAPGIHKLGPFVLDIDHYATPGDYLLRMRLGNASVDSLGLPNGIVKVLRRGRGPDEAPHARVEVTAPDTAVAGGEVMVLVRARIAPAPQDPPLVSVLLQSGRAAYAATEAFLEERRHDETYDEFSGQAVLDLPVDLSPGDCELHVSLMGPLAARACTTRGIAVASDGKGSRPVCHGLYRSAAGVEHCWRTLEEGLLAWDGLPYMPIGGMIRTRFLADYSPLDPEGNKDRWREFETRTRALADAGVTDVYLATDPGDLAGTPPDAVQRVVDRFEELGFRYGIEIGGTADDGFIGYLIGHDLEMAGVVAGAENMLPLNGLPFPPGPQALAVLYDDADGRPLGTFRLPIREGSIQLKLGLTEQTKGHTYTAFVTPQVFVPAGYGPGDAANDATFKARKAAVCRRLESVEFGDGLRFLSNPLGRDTGLPPGDVIPTFPSTFGLRFAEWLRSEYDDDLGTLRAAWKCAELPSFDAAGRSVPLTGPGGAGSLADEDAARLYDCQVADGSYVSDLEAFRQRIQAESLDDLVAAIKSIVDVPVILEPEAAGIVAASGDRVGALIRASREVGVHHVSRDPYYGPDGVALSPPKLPSDLARASLVARIAENRSYLKAPWLVATRAAPRLEPGTEQSLVRAATADLSWTGARAVFLQWASDELGDTLAPDIRGLPGLLSDLGRGSEARDLLSSAGPELVFTYPPRHRLIVGVRDDRPAALDGTVGGAPPVKLPDGRWLVPAPTPASESEAPLIVSLPCAVKNHAAARTLDSYLAAEPRASLLVLGTREDLGLVPTLDRLYTPDRRATHYGGGEAQVLASVGGLVPAGPSERGYPDLAHLGAWTLFPVTGLTSEDLVWLLCGVRPRTSAAVSDGRPGSGAWSIERDPR